MYLNEYQKSAARFYSPGLTRAQHYSNAGLGLAGEAIEVFDEVEAYLRLPDVAKPQKRTKLVEELGDHLWYVAYASRFAGWDLTKVVDLDESTHFDAFQRWVLDDEALEARSGVPLYEIARDLVRHAGRAAEVFKKHLHQGHELNRRKLIAALEHQIRCLAMLSSLLHVSFSEVAEGNVRKLEARYPEGHFTVARSVHRVEEVVTGMPAETLRDGGRDICGKCQLPVATEADDEKGSEIETTHGHDSREAEDFENQYCWKDFGMCRVEMAELKRTD